MSKKKKNDNNKVTIILITLIAVLASSLVIRYLSNKGDKPNNPGNNGGNISYEVKCGNDRYKYEPADYAVIAYGEINPFKDLDFSQKEFSIYVTIGEDGIHYSNGNLNQNILFNEKDVKQVGVDYDCNGFYYIYYLNNSGELYKIKLDDEVTSDNYKSELISKNIKGFNLLERKTTKNTSCDEYDLVIQYTDGKTFVNGCNSETLERIWIREAGREYSLYIVSKNAEVKNYLKNEKNENLIAKKVFVKETDKYGVMQYNIYVIDENEYLYFAENFNTGKLEKYKDSPVKNISATSDGYNVTFKDNTTDIIYANMVYSYN